MRFTNLAASVILIGAGAAFADAPATQPLMAIDQIPVPAPRVSAVAAKPAQGTVVVLPFEVIGDAGGREWVGRAVQQSLAAEVARLGGLSADIVSVAGPIDTAAARDAAAKNGGDLVIFGSYQFAGTDVRFTGEIFNAAQDKSIAGLNVSGDFRDLFAIEDQLSTQVRRSLRPVPPAPLAGANSRDDSMVFGKEAPPIAPDQTYAVPGDSERFSNDYSRYYTAPSYSPFLFTGGDAYPFEGGYNSFGTYYPLGYYNSQVIVVRHGERYGHHDRDSGPGSAPPVTPPRMITPPAPPAPVMPLQGGMTGSHGR